METAEGIVTLVQEGRFKLVTGTGRVMHFVLAHDAAIEPEDLPPLAARQTRVRVAYSRPDHLVAAIAHTLSTLDQQAVEATG
ncbi:MAG TPA: hypothetical protein VJ770_12675 [Stellaceae bacterium]|nr:hypothetical protein [Stellaceae bacterium]